VSFQKLNKWRLKPRILHVRRYLIPDDHLVYQRNNQNTTGEKNDILVRLRGSLTVRPFQHDGPFFQHDENKMVVRKRRNPEGHAGEV